MAPVEPELFDSNVVPLGTFAAQLACVLLSAGYIYSALRRASRTLPPSQDTRRARAKRHRDMRIFGLLAVVSSAIVAWHGLGWRSLSYEEWARKNGAPPPGGLRYGPAGGLGWQLAPWSRDTAYGLCELRREAMDRERGFWWTQQYLVGLVVWSLFVGVEGRRRNIPSSVIASFVALAQVASLSMAQSVFAIALLLTRVPLPRPSSTRRSPLWAPRPEIYIVTALACLAGVGFSPLIVRASDMAARGFAVAYFVVPLALALIHQITPLKWGRTYKDAHAAHRSYTAVFCCIAIAALLLHAKQTVSAVLEGAPPGRARTHDFVRTEHDEKRAIFEQAMRTVRDLLDAIGDHPAVSAIAWDVLFSGLGLCVWASVGALDVDGILRCSVLPRPGRAHDAASHERHVSFRTDGPLPRRNSQSHSVPPATPPPAPKRGRGRPKKSTAGSSSTATPSAQLRSSLRRAAGQQSDSDESAPPAGADADAAAAEHSEDGASAADSEAAAVSWGLFVLGGLGCLSSGALGAAVRS